MTRSVFHSLLIILLSLSGCISEKSETFFLHEVHRCDETPVIDSDWNKEFWNDTEALKIKNYMGEKPEHFPETIAKLKYDENNIYVIFRVDDQYIKAVETKTNGRVWEDSCVEFFFTPGPDTDIGYFNFEANCKGVYLFQYHLTDENRSDFVSIEDCKEISISHSLKKDVTNELSDPESWTIEYKIPIRILSNYMMVDKPDSDVIWRANFYKCADLTSHPHWLTWAPVDYPAPKFHLPEFFGRILFE